MSNIIIYLKDSNEISHYVKNAVIEEDNIIGDNIKLYGLKKQLWNFKWTDDELVFDEETGQWNKIVEEVNEIDGRDYETLKFKDRSELKQAMKKMAFISRLSDTQVDNYIDGLSDITEVKDFLKKITKINIAIIKMMRSKL